MGWWCDWPCRHTDSTWTQSQRFPQRPPTTNTVWSVQDVVNNLTTISNNPPQTKYYSCFVHEYSDLLWIFMTCTWIFIKFTWIFMSERYLSFVLWTSLRLCELVCIMHFCEQLYNYVDVCFMEQVLNTEWHHWEF